MLFKNFHNQLIVFLALVSSIFADDHEVRLMKSLMDKYDLSVRPALNFSHALTITFGLSLHHIIDVDEKNQILTTNCWLTQLWTDSHLTWNESEFGGIKVIRIPYYLVWRPDIILYNNADSQYASSVINTNVIVTSSGQVTWLSHGIYKSSCDINVEYFPFDVQYCRMKWASWTFDGYQLDLQVENEDADVSNYHNNGEFDLLGVKAIRNVTIYSCCPEPYPEIEYTIVMKRRPMFYVFNLIIPCFLINGIALLVFFVPCESGEKVTLGVSSLLSMTVFLMTIRESLPPTEQTPLISFYYGVCISIVSLASALAVFTLNIHHRGFRGVLVPSALRFFTLRILSKVLLCQGFSEPTKDETGESIKELRLQLNGLNPEFRLDHRSASRFKVSSQNSPNFEALRPLEAAELELKFSRIANKICQTLEKCELRSANQMKLDANQLEWKKIALVCDRLLFCIFCIVTVVSTVSILFSSPHTPTF